MRDVYAALLNDTLGRLVGLPLGLVVLVVAPVARHVVRLFDVEHGVDADHRRAGLVLLGRARLLLLVVKLVKQHVRGLLACANLPAHVVDLLVGGPAVIAVALRRLGDTEVDRIAAPIRRAGLDVFRAAARAGHPRRLPRRHALLDLRLAGRGERGVVVVLVPPGPGCLRRLCTPPGHALPPFPRDGLSARWVWNVLLSRRGVQEGPASRRPRAASWQTTDGSESWPRVPRRPDTRSPPCGSGSSARRVVPSRPLDHATI